MSNKKEERSSNSSSKSNSDNVRTFETKLSGSKGKHVNLEIPLTFPFDETRVHEYSLLILSSFGLTEMFPDGNLT